MLGQFREQLQQWIEENRLLRIDVIIQKSGRKTIFGRIVQFNQQTDTLLIYSDDHKTVESICMNQIDNIFPASKSFA